MVERELCMLGKGESVEGMPRVAARRDPLYTQLSTDSDTRKTRPLDLRVLQTSRNFAVASELSVRLRAKC